MAQTGAEPHDHPPAPPDPRQTHDTTALHVERRYSVTAVALSGGRRSGARLVAGDRRSFGLDPSRGVVSVPHPAVEPDWSKRTMTCGIALQCAPSKEHIGAFRLDAMSPRELDALVVAEAEAALGWVESRWPGLAPEIRRQLPGISATDAEADGVAIMERAVALARSRTPLPAYALLGRLPVPRQSRTLAGAARRRFGRMPWSSKRSDSYRPYSVPVGGDGGVRNPNLAPPSRPEDDEVEIRPDQRVGIPYPEWNQWTERFLPDHVAVLERRHRVRAHAARTDLPDVRRWFHQHTHREMRGRLEDGTDVDIDQYVGYHADRIVGEAGEARVFKDLLPGARDVCTALLLDASSSLGARNGQVFRLELACADALSQAMTAAKERHGIFAFTGNTRHRVDVRCLKDFADRDFVVPSATGLDTGGYTRLGAPLRHLTNRLVQQPAERRLLLVIGDGNMSDEGYEGRYAWADVAHAVGEAEEAGVSLYYIGLGSTRVDPLPDTFGARRSMRIRRVEDLPRVLARVHHELVTT